MMDHIDVENVFPRQTSLLFGDALILDDDDSRKSGSKRLIRYAKYWYWFRTTLPATATILFICTFLVPYFFFNTTNGFIFLGSLLSVFFCALALLSYLHVQPWRRHPSILMVMICLISSIMSSILLFMAAPYAGTREISDASDINLIGNSTYNSARDHDASCILMSFFIQLTLLAREGWILTLSVDLLTTITNPFSSHQSSVKRYHLCVWAGTVLSAVTLISQRSCQGEFLTNGTCWIKISGPDSLCFWGYLMSWVILFYLNSGAVLAYAFRRISSGLESTYATRYACVADTFRVVFLYFAYGMLLAVFFLVLFYATRQEVNEKQLFFLEHVFAYLIACRGFFDALIWFFSHGFVSTGAMTNMALTRSRFSLGRGTILKTTSNPHANTSQQPLTMREVLMPRSSFLTSCCCFFGSGKQKNSDDQLRQTLIDDEENGDEEDNGEESEEQLRESRRPFTTAEGTTLATVSNNITNSRSKSHNSSSQQLSPSHSKHSSRLTSSLGFSLNNSTGTAAVDDMDTSPQLNQALREEVLSLVTQGVKEAATRMIEREQRLLSLLQSAVVQDTLVEEISNKSEIQRISREEREEFERIRLDSNAAINEHNHHAAAASKEAKHNNQPNETSSSVAFSSFTTNSFTPNSHNNQPHYSSINGNQSYRSGRYNTAVHGLMSVMGSYLPGEYGVDPLVSSMRSRATDANQYHQNGTYHHSPIINKGKDGQDVEVHKEDNEDDDLLHQQSHLNPPSYSKSQHNRNELSRSLISEQTRLLQELQSPPAEVVFLLNNRHRFRDFRPATFKRLRSLSGLDEEHYLRLISTPGTQERLSEGRSGAFFFLCGDSELVIKTVSHDEARTLLRIIDDYYDHLLNHPESLLVRFIGLHEIRLYGNAFAFVVMKNIFPPKTRLSETYDLKGSYVARHAADPTNNSRKNRGKISTCRHCGTVFIEGYNTSQDLCPEVVGAHEASRTLKDNDLRTKIRLHPTAALTILEAIRADSDALCKMGLTDYSLLVGVKTARFALDSNNQIHDPDTPQRSLYDALNTSSTSQQEVEMISRTNNNNNGGGGGGSRSAFPARAVIAPAEYYFGIIDILQTWDVSKRLERFIKTNLFGQDRDGISCMAPRPFSKRFQRKMMSVIDHAMVVREVTGSWQGRRAIGSPFAIGVGGEKGSSNKLRTSDSIEKKEAKDATYSIDT